jgi:hypothetical protein
MLRASRCKDACSSWIESTAEKSVFPQILWGARTLYCVAVLGAFSWHWSFAAPAEQFLSAQRGEQTGARSKARTVTSAITLPCAVGPQAGIVLFILVYSRYPGADVASTARCYLFPIPVSLCEAPSRGGMLSNNLTLATKWRAKANAMAEGIPINMPVRSKSTSRFCDGEI